MNSLHSLKVPGELGDCIKLKELSLVENPLSDTRWGRHLTCIKSTLNRRLKKMAAQKGTKSVLDYIRANCPKVSRVQGTVQLETDIAPGWRWRRRRRRQRGERQRKEREGQEQGESRARGQRSGPGDQLTYIYGRNKLPFVPSLR